MVRSVIARQGRDEMARLCTTLLETSDVITARMPPDRAARWAQAVELALQVVDEGMREGAVGRGD